MLEVYYNVSVNSELTATMKPIGVVYTNDDGSFNIVMGNTVEECLEYVFPDDKYSDEEIYDLAKKDHRFPSLQILCIKDRKLEGVKMLRQIILPFSRQPLKDALRIYNNYLQPEIDEAMEFINSIA